MLYKIPETAAAASPHFIESVGGGIRVLQAVRGLSEPPLGNFFSDECSVSILGLSISLLHTVHNSGHAVLRGLAGTGSLCTEVCIPTLFCELVRLSPCILLTPGRG